MRRWLSVVALLVLVTLPAPFAGTLAESPSGGPGRPFEGPARPVLAAALEAADVEPVAAAKAGEPGWRRLDLPETGSYAWRYLPAALAGAAPSDGHPVIVFLHGSGASPEIWRPFLEGPADAAGAVVVAPAPSDPFGWGIADDSATVAEAVDHLGAELPIDRARIGLAGHSAGGAYAYFLAYETRGRFSGVFSFSAPFRFILGVADPEYTPPLRLWYGQEDPNFLGGHLNAIAAMVEHRQIPWEVEVVPGVGHNDIRQQDLEEGFAFLVSQERPRENRLLPKKPTEP